MFSAKCTSRAYATMSETTEGKIYSPVGNLAEQAKQSVR